MDPEELEDRLLAIEAQIAALREYCTVIPTSVSQHLNPSTPLAQALSNTISALDNDFTRIQKLSGHGSEKWWLMNELLDRNSKRQQLIRFISNT